MKRVIRKIRRFYYRFLFFKLFWTYTKAGMDAYNATENANEAFGWLTAFEYADLFKNCRKPDV